MKPQKKFGIFGGLFDPPHLGHLIIAQTVLEEFRLNQIIFVPAGNPPHKRKYSPYRIRFKLTEAAIKNNKNFSLSPIESQIAGKTYTVEVIKAIKQKINGQFYLIIGSDQWHEIKTWKDPQELLKYCALIVVPRPAYKIKVKSFFSKKIFIAHTPLIQISSTVIRKRVKQKQTIQYFVPPAVNNYIKKKKLYLT